MSKIPARARTLVKNRYAGRCARCGMKGGHWHHRRSRAVHNPHTHCPCNGLYLCTDCHDWAHAHPDAATLLGFIVSRYEEHPYTVPVHTPWGIRRHDCRGVSL